MVGKTYPLRCGERAREGLGALRRKGRELTLALLLADLAIERDIEPKSGLMWLAAPSTLSRIRTERGTRQALCVAL